MLEFHTFKLSNRFRSVQPLRSVSNVLNDLNRFNDLNGDSTKRYSGPRGRGTRSQTANTMYEPTAVISAMPRATVHR